MRNLPPRIKAAVLMFVCFGAGLLLALSPTPQPRPRAYDQIVNKTLDMVLVVGSELKERHPTWEQIEKEVAHRMKVKRVEPWEAK